ncbi:MAG: DUF4430 domain-containing protein [Ruminococcaceae bacterium]|nr:DUF4430 domain-containing protein [Oscillospiraceae bacterium]
MKTLRACSLLLLCLLLLCPLKASAAEQEIVSGWEEILAYRLSEAEVPSLSAWINGPLASAAGITAEWNVLALSQNSDQTFASYEPALLAYLEANSVPSATTRQKYALCLVAIGSTNRYIQTVLDSTIGEQGITSLIFGLHLLNNGYVSATHSAEKIRDTLLSLQTESGGWALNGKTADIDITAMTLQALAPYAEEADVSAAISRALAFLSSSQTESGDYISYGEKNPESTAQVIVALSALGIDCEADARFIKNGTTLWDAVARFRLSDGSYCHRIGDQSNENATAQVFCAMAAYLRLMRGDGSLFLFDRANPAELDPAPLTTEKESEGEPPAEIGSKPSLKLVFCFILVGLALFVCLLLLLLRKHHRKNIFTVLLLTVIAVAILLFSDIQRPEDYYGTSIPKENPIGSVTISIRCDAILGLAGTSHLPEDGILLPEAEFLIEEGDSVYDILIEAAKQYRIPLDNSGTEAAPYFVGIGQVYANAFGQSSGWQYRVNGQSPAMGCASFELSDGDTIVWFYTLSFEA